MDVRILDLDGSVTSQTELVARTGAAIVNARDWAPGIRLTCSFGRYRRFERALADRFGSATDSGPTTTFFGSGDFHHVTLALLHRLTRPFNLLVLDKHPDWMRYIPLMHCGTWVNHAARLPLIRNVFHAGGDLDFDNAFRWLAPWDLLRSGRIRVLPAVRRFQRGRWDRLEHQPLRTRSGAAITSDWVQELIAPYCEELRRWPLYISVDKDVMRVEDAVVNWDSGQLTLDETTAVLDAFRTTAGELIGMDLTGDWSPVETHGMLRRVMHWTEHPALNVDPQVARRRNQHANLALLAARQIARVSSAA